MHKAERLFNLVTLLRGRRTAITADAIAQVMEVSVRTIYRDIQALTLSGIPVEGEPGVGYVIRRDYQLPPLMFTPEEALAVAVGAKMVQAFTDPELAVAARQAEDKIRAILTEDLKLKLEQQPYAIPIMEEDAHHRETHLRLRRACERRQKIQVIYQSLDEQTSQRVLWPLGMVGWFGKWTLLAWCELRKDYRNFRFDRFEEINCLDEHYETSPTISLQHYLKYRTCD